MLERLEDWMAADAATRASALDAVLERIRRDEPSVRAWVEVRPQPRTADGPLSGIPVAIKDVIETKHLATEYGSSIYKGRRGDVDAAIVQHLRSLGAVVLGKTEAAAFAYKTPPPTRNPRNLDHTPGGSSSGSAAAVAAGMVPVAVGTQTLGSVLRPASFCGVVGFKPTYGALSIEGVLPVAPSLDTLGFFTHTTTGMLRLWQAVGQTAGTEEEVVLGAVDPLPAVDSQMAAAFRLAIDRLMRSRVSVERVTIAPSLIALDRHARIVMAVEAARVHGQRYREHGDRLLDLANLVREGMHTSDERYRDAVADIAEQKERMNSHFARTPVILTPSAPGPAPRGLASTGDARLNSPWTALGTPAVSIPMPVNDGELPLGLQITAAPGQDARVLRQAIRIEAALAGS